MAKTKLYFQCDLSQNTGRDTAFIEERGAVIDKTVELGGTGTGNFWRVTSVSDRSFTSEEVKAMGDKSQKGWGSLIDI